MKWGIGISNSFQLLPLTFLIFTSFPTIKLFRDNLEKYHLQGKGALLVIVAIIVTAVMDISTKNLTTFF